MRTWPSICRQYSTGGQSSTKRYSQKHCFVREARSKRWATFYSLSALFFGLIFSLRENCSESVRYRFHTIPEDYMSPKTEDFRQRMAILSLNPFPSDPDDTALLTRPNERLGRFRHALATCTCQIPSGGNVYRSKCPICIRTTTRTVRADPY